MAEVLIKYKADAGDLEATVKKINEVNNEAVKSAQKASDKIATEFKDAAKSAAAAFSGGEVKKALEGNATALEKLTKSGKSLTGQLRGLKAELTLLEQQGKDNTAEFNQLLIAASKLEDQIGDTRARVRILASDTFKFDAAVQATQGLAAGFEVAQGAAALFGSESEDLQKSILKVQGAIAVANGVQQIANLLLEESAVKTAVLTTAQRAYSIVVGTSTGALKAFRIALAATGVGLLVIAIGELIANFDKIKDSIAGTDDSTRALSAAVKESTDAIKESQQSVLEVGNAFELAKAGVISQEEALLTYNETLGDSFGKQTNFNKAQEEYIKKKDAYIQATAARAQAQALLAQSAQLAAEAATVTGDQATDFGEKIQTFIGDAVVGFNKLIGNTASTTSIIYQVQTEKIRKNAKERVQTEKNAQAETLKNLAQSKFLEAETIENSAGIISEAEQKVIDNRNKLAEQAAKERAELEQKQREEQNKRVQESLELQKEFEKKQREESLKQTEEAAQKQLEIEKRLRQRIISEVEQTTNQQFTGRINFLKALELEEGSSLDRRIQIIELEAKERQRQIKLNVNDTFEANQLIRIDEAETQKAIRDERKKSADEQIEKLAEIAQATADLFGNIIELQGIQSQKRIEEINAASEAEKLAIEQSALSEADKQRKLEALQLRTAQKVAAEKRKQAVAEKAAAIFEATINAAVAVAKAAGNPVQTAIAIAAGAAQIAIIAATPIPKFKRGGMVGGRSHEAGGTLIEAERGEFVVNRNAVSRHRSELDALNTSSAAFKKLIDERYVRPALNYYMGKKDKGVIVNASLNSKGMEKKLDRLNKTMSKQRTIVNINGNDSRYSWHLN